MGLVNWKLNKFTKPNSPEERSYAIFGKKLLDIDSKLFSSFKEDYASKLQNRIRMFFLVIAFVMIISLITLYMGVQENWSTFTLSTSILFFFLYFIYIAYFIPYTWMGIYARSWCKLLEYRDETPKLTLYQKLTHKYSSILYPKIKTYLENKDISLIITDTDIIHFTPSLKNFDKIKRQHIIFDKSVIKK